MCKNNFGSELGGDCDCALRHCKRFVRTWRVCPAHHVLNALVILAESLADCHDVRHAMTRVVLVALHIDDRHVRPICEILDGFVSLAIDP